MIPGSFEYHRPRSLDDALSLLASAGEDARPLSGGHSLIPMMKLRMAAPSALIDLGGVAELRGIEAGTEAVTIGAMTTMAAIAGSAPLAARVPLLREAALVIADPQVRARGTIGGNVANGDPGNDMPAVMLCLNATFLLAGKGDRREVSARGFYEGAYMTGLRAGEVLAGVRIKTPSAGHGWAYEKLKRKVGDYATAAAAVVLTMDGGRVSTASVGLTNVAEIPLYAEEAGSILVGSSLDAATLDRAVAAAETITRPAEDGRGPAEYRTRMAGVMLRRALARAGSRAGIR